MKKARSARGVEVDFDLLKIKETIGSAPPSFDVKARQDFIDKKLRRRIRRAKVETKSRVIETEKQIVDGESQREFIDTTEPSKIKQKTRLKPDQNKT